MSSPAQSVSRSRSRNDVYPSESESSSSISTASASNANLPQLEQLSINGNSVSLQRSAQFSLRDDYNLVSADSKLNALQDIQKKNIARRLSQSQTQNPGINKADIESESVDQTPFCPQQDDADANAIAMPRFRNRTLSMSAQSTIPDVVAQENDSIASSNSSQSNKNGALVKATTSQVKKDDSKYKMGMLADDPTQHILEHPSPELVELYSNVQKCRDLRKKYQTVSFQYDSQNPKNDEAKWEIYPTPPKPSYDPVSKTVLKVQNVPDHEIFDYDSCEIPGIDPNWDFQLNSDDTFCVFAKNDPNKTLIDNNIPTLRDYYVDLEKIILISSDGPSKSFAFRRLQYLEARWNLYYLLNEYHETNISKKNPHRDFYNVRKVDTHVHHSACMNQKHLLRFIKHKLRHNGDEKVIFRDDKVLTLNQVFESLNLTGYDLSIDTLDMHAHKDTFHRFDKFNLKYNPIGESRLREIFMKTDNFIQGRYLAEITRQVFADIEYSKYQNSEFRISIYGRSIDEWDKLATWIIDNKLISHNVRWLIQIPRLYGIYKSTGIISNFQQICTNIFKPLFEVTRNPQSHPKLHVFLQRVIGFDSVDDESKVDRRFHKKYPIPSLWESSQNPPYSYYLYYLYSNLAYLNQWRAKRGFNTLVLRPHCGEAGDPEHLISSYLVSHGISHGILLRKVPFVQYLYYLDQIGIAMSPLSNNALFLTYDKNPFPHYFKRGLNVSLSTDDPLQFSYTREPLIEEYSVAAQIYKLSNVDMCELARNSVLQSGWETEIKKHWIGENFTVDGMEGNDLAKTNVPDIRISYRDDTLKTELELVNHFANFT
ncbi:hypothetical protein TBLA_0C01920 [Henningerozyma blattae CBS 6284]|uniref:AMP deaminase n=1 Tax=Henningerozyma blattae (strain ATCC 34711 / CBS 6284 / DSM 70876 / NBRC 10599 / NRRL Y-10934 / UCD 77-7) TaxID=1071380 RepID=I2H0V3_HENB6|nr:hypothetical protein TBLA_0C01920 [Tetrapisispora blattae CBS 6284]CCH60005.1 hypothetical protein TBLA_0C01920 [Tetrapisispora blattae CBS 6284]